MKPMLIALCLCLPLMGADKEKPLPKDIKSLKALAEKGDAKAQNNLGMMYYEGKGVKKDYVTAYGWFNFAFQRGNFIAGLNMPLSRVTDGDFTKAEELAKEMVKKNPKLLKK